MWLSQKERWKRSNCYLNGQNKFELERQSITKPAKVVGEKEKII